MYRIFVVPTPVKMAIRNAPEPEPIPFIITICNGFLRDSLLVQLFSTPQKTQASKTKTAPSEKVRLLKSSTDRIMLETVINAIASHILFPTASLKAKRAMIAVATISKLLRSEAVAEVVIVKPSISKIGAAISKMTIATVYGNSFFVIRASLSAVRFF